MTRRDRLIVFLTLLFLMTGLSIFAALMIFLHHGDNRAIMAVSVSTLLPRITSLINEQQDVQNGVGLYTKPHPSPAAPLLDRLPALPYALLTNVALGLTWLAIMACGMHHLHPALTLIPAALHLGLLVLRDAERNRTQTRLYAAAQVCSPETYNDLELGYADTHRMNSDERQMLLTHRP